ncbi:alpha/beta-type small acid-soluble spore protein [Lutispora saccharofermentans]|uniref:Alpha/beta-type small acid-soluble spore protein n=1 Tax=Lutispora saccharofermentans TaxID=3024236 RepID=A0ABT1NLR1_9FIRM|nr:alpha/beta-type small acid-soluble spore protein [Lutispora saccharofermentans]MCQ1531063.1 alpha/beta-type small acid-soluble spore protein [Lutispora saccharofermentans]
MALGSGNYNKGLEVPNAHKALDNMKYEIAAELNLPVYQGSEDYWGNLSSKDCGRVGGQMVKRMISMAQSQMTNQ